MTDNLLATNQRKN